MIEIRYQYPGDPMLPARLMFGVEFKEERGPGQVKVHAINAKGETTETIEGEPFDEAICDLCNSEVDDVDPCVITGERLYCWPCAKEWVLKHRVPGSQWVR